MALSSENIKQYIPPAFPNQRYYTLREVCEHNTANNCWVILFGEVYDLTKLIQQNIHHPASRPLIKAAGTDVTYWFDYSSRQPRVKVNVQTGKKQFYCPQGEYLQLQSENQIKWWKDQKNILGKLTKKSRLINLTNMITDHTSQLQVPCQQIINQILSRYKKFNKHGGSYIWKRLGRPLDMQKTLDENGIYDQDKQFQVLGIQSSKWYVPTVHLFFNDDLTVA